MDSRYRDFVRVGLTLLLLGVLCACTPPVAIPAEDVAVDEQTLPVLPLERFAQYPSAVKVLIPRTALHTHDERFPIVGYTSDGQVEYRTVDAVIFPTDVALVLTGGETEPLAFLARSPHGGCPVRWNDEETYFEEWCYGSKWYADGRYFFGPALQDLDQLPVEVRDGMIWVTNRILRGAPRTS